MRFTPALLSFAAAVAAHGDHDHDQEPLAGPHEGLWYNTLPGDGGTQVRSSIPQLKLCNRNSPLYRPTPSSPVSPHSVACHTTHASRLTRSSISPSSVRFRFAPGSSLRSDNDIGAPFDTGTSYRPGARFGPSGIRQGSRRLNL
jgi:agmatinase